MGLVDHMIVLYLIFEEPPYYSIKVVPVHIPTSSGLIYLNNLLHVNIIIHLMVMYKVTFKVFVLNNCMFNIFSLTGNILAMRLRLLGEEQSKMDLFKL